MTEPRLCRIVRTYRIGDNSDEGYAATIGDLIECDCCGRKITNVAVMANGDRVGTECSTLIERPDLRSMYRQSKRVAAHLARLNAEGWA